MFASRPLARWASLALLVAVTAGCSSAPTTTPAAATKAVTGTTTPAPSASPASEAEAVQATVSKPKIDAKARKAFSASDIDAAWAFASGLGARTAFRADQLAIPWNKISTATFAESRAAMTAGARKDFDAAVKGATASKRPDQINVLAFATVGLTFKDFVLAADPLSDFSITGSVSVNRYGNLHVVQRQKATIHYTATGKPRKYTYVKDVSWDLQQIGRGWAVDGWSVTLNSINDGPDNR